eukprot:TRINITY_DN9617_c0_g1_i1.p1 TRINITY_DN9617_c0_g1~~TRINITY_DN9617_c0_g1_i1.p1  ORF type:complete len:634 (-),score=146.63 TRINITY_DN9617_c0_g1_i1:62-1906(-)
MAMMLWMMALLWFVVSCAGTLAPPTTTVEVSIDWTSPTVETSSIPTLQVVVNPMIRRGSPIHDLVFEQLAGLNASHVRFVPWLPYPQLGVAELQAPSGNPLCATVVAGESMTLSCDIGVIESIDFASYGNPSGGCSNFQQGDCAAGNSMSVVSSLCLGKAYCTIPVNSTTFPVDCTYQSQGLMLSVQVTCSPAVQGTSWDFTLIDPLMEDFLNATQPNNADKKSIINFSTIPQWMFNAPEVWYPEDPNQVFWSYEQGTELLDQTGLTLGNYYKRLVSWYVNGGFSDEYGVYHSSGYNYNITHWEVLNEVESEHSMTVQQYTARYDAIVSGIREAAPWMKFVGLALCCPSGELDWFEYFLNKSNHAPGIPIDYISYHFYASASSRTDPSTYTSFFSDADGFFELVTSIEKVRMAIAPEVKTDIDELGVILPNDNDIYVEQFPDIYWNAAAAHYTYVFMNLAQQGIHVMGESQLVGFPSQYPSVSMVNYTTGAGTARLWVLKLLLEHFGEGRTQQSFSTTSSNATAIYAQAWTDNNEGGVGKLLIINKTFTTIEVQINSSNSYGTGTVYYVDETTGFGPAQQQTLSSSTLQTLPYGIYLIVFSAPSTSSSSSFLDK